MKKIRMIHLVMGVLLVSGVATYAAETKKDEVPAGSKAQTTCPVMGGKINKAQYADVNGKRIYVCCPGCIGKIEAAPEKYIKQLEAEGIVLDKVPAKKESKKESKKKHDHSGHNHAGCSH